MAYMHVISRQPSGRSHAISPETRTNNGNFSGDSVARESTSKQQTPLTDLDGRAMIDGDLRDTPLKGCHDLESVDKLYIRQRMPFDLKANCGSGNTYNILDQNGQMVFHGVEDRNCCCRWCCGPARMTHLTLYNRQEQAVLHLDRACCRCDWCCCLDCFLCQHKLVVRDWRGEIIGVARQKFHCFNLKMDVSLYEDKKPFCAIRGPCCPCRCCTDINFDIVSTQGQKPLGYVYKRFDGFRDDVNVDHENTEVYYPRGLSLPQKVTLLGAAFLVDLMYFEMS